MNINKILGITESYKAPETVLKILYDRKKREKIFLEFLKAFKHDVSYDWFHAYFEDEHADRKKKKQDFTPDSVSDIMARLTGAKRGMVYEIAAGTGGMTIRKWWSDCLSETPFTYFPSKHFYVCEELSDRAMPFLLFNLMIRGMNAAVVHCDVLSRECKGVFYVNNKKDDFLRFSDLNLMPYSKQVEDYFKVKFNNFRYPPIKEILESETV